MFLTIEKSTEKSWKWVRILLITDCNCDTEHRASPSCSAEPSGPFSPELCAHAPYLGVGVLKGSVGGHVFDDVRQHSVGLPLLIDITGFSLIK